ncbi:MAG: DUF2953 domain-containing protein [Lachnospiraceae bacterium]|nr:DUF2953 domain-containing protein [Lachnospiraceae bacterium]
MLLFTILKVIGLVLLFLLLLILLLLGLVLLVPIRYAGAGHKGEEKSDYAAHVDVRWLLYSVQLHAGLTPAGLAYYLRILCFHPIDSRPPDTPPANASDETLSASCEDSVVQDKDTDVSVKQSSEDEKSPEDGVTAPESKVESAESAAAQTAEVDSIELTSCPEPEPEAKDETTVLTSDDLTTEDAPGTDEKEDTSTDEDQKSETKSTAPAAEAPKKKKRKKSSFADRIKRICEKVSSLREAVEDEENQKAFRLLISRVKYLIHHLRFRRFEGRLMFGFDDPAMMGRILAVLSLFYPLYGESFTITPVFDHTLFEGEIALKGHVRLIHILIAAIQLMMNKKIRGLVLDRI